MKRPTHLAECLALDHPKPRMLREAAIWRCYAADHIRETPRRLQSPAILQAPEIRLRDIFLSPRAKAACRELLHGVRWHLAALSMILAWRVLQLLGVA
jgi:hypothetical protein